MIDRLYPAEGDNNSQRNVLIAQAGATSVALRLADEFAAAFGRTALDQLILDHTPDQDFVPGPLHKMLVDLPWADILTTNYDTLLERAAEEGYGRRYSVVRTQAELPASGRPRIVKLHGSFPSTRPFVFSEEDFRTYPQQFAAFVNLARQSVLESVLCLIGFSGDDPNFLAWTGWVRDQLAEYSPRVYLCGLLDLTNAQRSVLQGRGVVPIDLTPRFPADAYPEPGERHRQALEWFLTSLRHGRPYDPMEWPNAPPADPESPGGKQAPLASTQAVPKPERFSPPDVGAAESKSPADRLLATAEVWAKNRQLYPGWLIAPDDVRNRLVHKTNESWQAFYLQNRSGLSRPADLNWLYELNWRLETALVPIWDHLVPAYEQVLTALNPFPNVVTDLGGSPLSPDAPDDDPPDWSVARHQWLAVACGLLRHYREERKWADFDRWANRIAAVTDAPPDTRARLCYERCLRGLSNLDDAAVDAGLGDWPSETHDPFWAVRRAGLLAEVGRTQDAATLVDATLRRLRRGLEDTDLHIPALSREGWAVWMAHGLESAATWRAGRFGSGDARRSAVRQRYRQLRPFGAEPDDLADGLKLRLDGPPPVRKPAVERRHGFEPGRMSRTSHGGDGLIEKVLPAYQFMRLCEESGVPPSAGSSLFSDAHLKRAAEWFRELDPVRTQSLMFRLLDKQVTDGYLTRHRLAALPSETVADWRASCLKAVREALPDAGRGVRDETDNQRRSRERLQTAATILARTAVRATDAELTDLWKLFVALYRSEECRVTMSGDNVIRPLLDNLLRSSTNDVLSDQVRPLFDLPLPGEPGFEVWRDGYWPDPAADVAFKLLSVGWQPPKDGWGGTADRLIRLLDADKLVVRMGALLRLLTLDKAKLVRQSDRARVGRAFWSTNLRSDSLPDDRWGEYALSHALVWPPPNGVNAAERVKRRMLKHKLGEVFGLGDPERWFDHLMSFSDPGKASPAAERLSWTASERLTLFGILRDWWDTHGSKQAAEFAAGKEGWFFDRDAFGRFVVSMWDVVREVLLVQPNGGGRVGPLVAQLVTDVENAGLPVGCVMPAILRVDPGQYGRAAAVIRRELTSGRAYFRFSALRGLVFWADAHRQRPSNRPLPEPPADLIRELGAAVAMRHAGDIRLLLNAASAIVRRQAAADGQFVESLLIGLEFLFTETQYRDRKGDADTIPYEQVPLVRWECVRLARRLSDAGNADDQRVRRWLEAAAVDPLPEVRAAAGNSVTDDDDD